MLRCVFGPNLDILIFVGGDLSHRQAQNGVNFEFYIQFDLEDHGQSPHKTIGILTKVFYISGAKFGDPSLNGLWVIVGTSSWLTDTWTHTTHTHTQATTIPKGQNWSHLKMTQLFKGWIQFSEASMAHQVKSSMSVWQPFMFPAMIK